MNSLITRRTSPYTPGPLASLLSFSRDFDRLFEGSAGLRSVENSFAPALELRLVDEPVEAVPDRAARG